MAFNNITLSREATDALLMAVKKREQTVQRAIDMNPTEFRWEYEYNLLDSLRETLTYILDKYDEVEG